MNTNIRYTNMINRDMDWFYRREAETARRRMEKYGQMERHEAKKLQVLALAITLVAIILFNVVTR